MRHIGWTPDAVMLMRSMEAEARMEADLMARVREVRDDADTAVYPSEAPTEDLGGDWPYRGTT